MNHVISAPEGENLKPVIIETHRHKRGASARATVLTQGLDDLVEITDPRIGLEVEIATPVWTLLSQVIGEGTGWRSFTANVCQALAGIAHLPIVDKDPSTGAEISLPAPLPTIPVAGWPNTDSAIRRFGWTPDELNEEWNKQVAASGGFARLPLPLVVQIFPPAIWQVVALITTWTPAKMHRYMEAYFRVLIAGSAPGGFKREPRSADAMQDAVRRLLRRMVKSRESGYYADALQTWTQMPARVVLTKGAPAVGGESHRPVNEAPKLRNTRRYLAELDRQITDRRRTARGRRHLLVLLRDRALLETATVTASRCEPLGVMKASDILPAYPCPWDGVKRPAVKFRQLKGKRWTEHIVVITEKHYSDIAEYMEYAGIAIGSDHQMWHGQWAYFDKTTGEQVPAEQGSPLFETKTGRERVVRILPNCAMTAGSMGSILATLATRCGEPGVHHTAHSLRHLGNQICKDAAKAYLAAHPETPGSVTIEAITKSLMAHEFKSVSDVYDELNKPTSKQKWAAVGALGIWSLLRGPAGAQQGLDEPRILAALEQLQENDSELRASVTRATDAEDVLRTIEDGTTPMQQEIRRLREQRAETRSQILALLDSGTATDADFRRGQLKQEHLDDEIERRQEDLLLSERRLNRMLRDEHVRQIALEKRHETFRQELESAKAARVPLPDLSAPYDLQTRLAELLGECAPEEGIVGTTEPTPVREKLTVAEYARVMGIPLSTLNRQIKAALASKDGFAFAGGRENPRQPFGQPIEQVLEVHGKHSRFVVYPALDKSWYHPDQIPAMKAVLARPA